MSFELRDKRVTVMGLGRFGGGVGVARWLVARGSRVTVTDLAPAEKLTTSIEALRDCDVMLRLGGHDERDFRQADLVVVNPAVPDSSPYVQAARAAGVPLSTEINLFVERCRATCVGVTGSVGKSTITAMIGHVLERTLARRVWVGGNLGRSLLDELSAIGEEDVAVLELSSFQLARTPAVQWSPHVAVITNITPNHLDWHGTFDHYADSKLNLVAFQKPDRDVVIIEDIEPLRRILATRRGRGDDVWHYGLDRETPIATRTLSTLGETRDLRTAWPELRLAIPGRHNRLNAAAALSVAEVFGVEGAAATRALASFEGLPHRLQRAAQRDGVTYYNDSKSTTPEAAITAMNAIDGPLLLILGGYDKHIDLAPAARSAAERARFVACIGQTGAALRLAVQSAGGHAELFESFESAVIACQREARPGDSVLLSPACASWDMFEDYRARGDAFVRLVRQ
ncbi:MAG: UDP-N-acetylmuramoyl-L-alanine--D-glutamate ligase [Phycisphaerae bacterium]